MVLNCFTNTSGSEGGGHGGAGSDPEMSREIGTNSDSLNLSKESTVTNP